VDIVLREHGNILGRRMLKEVEFRFSRGKDSCYGKQWQTPSKTEIK
jgi:hypothetical protein